MTAQQAQIEATKNSRYPLATRQGADSAARRACRKLHGKNYQPTAGVDFTVFRAPTWHGCGWGFELISAR